MHTLGNFDAVVVDIQETTESNGWAWLSSIPMLRTEIGKNGHWYTVTCRAALATLDIENAHSMKGKDNDYRIKVEITNEQYEHLKNNRFTYVFEGTRAHSVYGKGLCK